MYKRFMGKTRDNSHVHIGLRYGKWVVTGQPVKHTKKSPWRVPCRCDCGFQKEVVIDLLDSGHSLRCRTCCGTEKRKLSPGDKLHWWTVIKYSDTDPRRVLCQCRCGTEQELIAGNLTSGKGKPKKCKNCRTVHGDKSDSKTYWISITSGAKARNLEIGMTWEEAKAVLDEQKNRCALTGLPIYLPKSSYQIKTSLKTASIDRIDSSKGYIKGNVQWVHKHINHMKLDFGQNEFINYCVLVADKYRNESGELPDDIDFDAIPWDRRMKRQDEIDLETRVRAGETPRNAGERLGIPTKRVDYLCRKWTNLGWYEYGDSCDLGWVKSLPETGK